MRESIRKNWRDYTAALLMMIVILGIAIISIVRACKVSTVESALTFGGQSNGRVQLFDSTYLEMEFTVPEIDINGISFRFTGEDENFGDKKFHINISNRNDELNPVILYDNELLLCEQPYDYQTRDYVITIPFERGEIYPYDYIRIAIMGLGIKEEDNICIHTSTRMGLDDVRLEVNDFEQEYVLAGKIYYNTTSRGGYEPLLQGVLIILLILIGGTQYIKIKQKKPRQKREINWKEVFTRQHLLQFAVVMLLLSVGIEYAYYSAIKPRAELAEPIAKVDTSVKDNGHYITLIDGMSIMSEYTATEDELAGIGIYLGNFQDQRGIFHVGIREQNEGEGIAVADKAICEFETADEGYLQINFDTPIQSHPGMQYLISLSYEGEDKIHVLADERNIDTFFTIGLYHHNTFLKGLYLTIALLIYLLSIIYFWCSVIKIKLEKMFLMAIIFLGILFGIVITPYAVPDETSHIDTAYRISNKILGVAETGINDAIYRRECDVVIDTNNKIMLGTEQYRWAYDNPTDRESINTLKIAYAGNNLDISNAVIYLPAAIGMTIGRLLGVGFLPMISLARTCNFLVCIWMIYCALRKIPVGKSILCVLALLPVGIQELASCSYDALTLATALVFTAYSVAAIYKKGKVNYDEILVLLFTGITLMLCKGGAYTPLCLLLIPAVAPIVTRNEFVRKRKKEIIIATIILAVLISIPVYIKIVYPMLGYSDDPYVLRNNTYNLGYLLHHPAELFRIVENTISHNIDMYIQTIVGDRLGSLQVSVGFLTQVCYIGLLMATVIANEKRPGLVKVKEKIVFLGAVLLSTGAIMAALLLYSTRFGIGEVSGVQGRYFLPILWLVLICFRQGKVIYKKKPYRKIITTGYILGIWTVLQILIEVLRIA